MISLLLTKPQQEASRNTTTPQANTLSLCMCLPVWVTKGFVQALPCKSGPQDKREEWKIVSKRRTVCESSQLQAIAGGLITSFQTCWHVQGKIVHSSLWGCPLRIALYFP